MLALVLPREAVAQPKPYKEPFHQAPVRADRDELMLIPGAGFGTTNTVVFKSLTNTTSALPSPTVPASDAWTHFRCTTTSTYCRIVDVSEFGLTVRLPASASNYKSGQSYAVWTRTSGGTWSAGIKINDARPLWFTPMQAFRTASSPGLGRTFKVVGRNLEPAPGAGMVTKVRFTKGSLTYTLNALDENSATDRYAARVTLPASMEAGAYTVSVQRDGVSWQPLPAPLSNLFWVVENPASSPAFNVGDAMFGGCQANDGIDDSDCIIAALKWAGTHLGASGRADVVFGLGTWELKDSNCTFNSAGGGTCSTPDETILQGIVVPVGVNMRGPAGTATKPVIMRRASWAPRVVVPTDLNPSLDEYAGYLTVPARYVFTTAGNNTISGLRFDDDSDYQQVDARLSQGGFFALGNFFSGTLISDVVFTNNEFANGMRAIQGAQPMARLVITDNELSAYQLALFISNASHNMPHYQLRDSVIRNNLFLPGDYEDLAAHQGTFASELGAGVRVDFSDNDADGRDMTYTSTLGWRAAFFFYLANNHEMVLVSNNHASCTGSKAGDGEAIAFDNNGNQFGFRQRKPVTGATTSSVTVSVTDGDDMTLSTSQFDTAGNPLPTPPGLFDQHWVHVVDGAGLGQARKISSITSGTGTLTFNVTPAWDVTPTILSRVEVTRQYWQVHTVDNSVDNTSCGWNENHHGASPGEIGLAAVMTDSTVEGNVGYEAAAIYIDAGNVGKTVPQLGSLCGNVYRQFSNKYFVEVRGNLQNGEPNFPLTCSDGGIGIVYGGGTMGTDCNVRTPADVYTMFGVNVVGNAIYDADTLKGGGIGIWPGFWQDQTSDFMHSVLIQNNFVSASNSTSYDAVYESVVENDATTNPFDVMPFNYGCPNVVRKQGIKIGSEAETTEAQCAPASWTLAKPDHTILWSNSFANISAANEVIDCGAGTVIVP